jgi:hypothetical protein
VEFGDDLACRRTVFVQPILYHTCHEKPRQADRTSFALAELFCRAADRIDPTRVFGSYGDLGRGAFALGLEIPRRLLQWYNNASILEQGCTGFFARFRGPVLLVHVPS